MKITHQIISSLGGTSLAKCIVVIAAFFLTATSSLGATFTPYFFDVRITGKVDTDGDGYARQFDIEFDVDSNISGQYYVKIYEYDGSSILDDYLTQSSTFTVNGGATDYQKKTIVCSSYPGADQLSHGTAEFKLELYNAANNSLVQTWTPSNDSDLGNVLVELSSEDTAPTPTLSRSPSSLTTSVAQGQNAASQSFEVWNSASGTLSYTVSDDASWLSVSPSSGTSTGEHDTITVSYSTSGLSAGTYTATITITASGAGGSPQTIPVTLTVNAPPPFAPYFFDVRITGKVDTDGDGYARQFDIEFDVDSNISGQYYVKIYEYDGSSILDDYLTQSSTFTVNGGATDYQKKTIVCDNYPGADQLSHGTAEFKLELYNAANNSLVQTWTPSNDSDLGNVLVELSSEDTAPTLSRSPSTLSSSVAQGQNAANQSFEVWNSGGGTLSYTVSDDASWLSVSPGSGTSTGEHDTITVSYSTSGLSAGTYTATITITASGAGGSPQTIPVTLTVNPPPPTIISAYWLAPVNVTEGTVVTMRAQVSGFSVGDQFSFEIREDDAPFGYDTVTPTRTGTVYASGGNYFVDATWPTVWQADQSGDPEFYFVVSRVSVSKESSRADVDEMHVAQAPILSCTPSMPSPSVTQGQNAANQSFEVWNSGGGTLNYTISDDASWLSVNPTSGSSTGGHNTHTVTYSTSGLSAGTYIGTITITASGASGSPRTIAVTLTVNPPPPTIISAYWLAPTSVIEGTVVTMRAQVSGFNVGDQFSFEIREDDGAFGYDTVTPTRTGTVYASGGNYFVDTTWTTVWQADQSGDPEFFFVVSRAGVSRESSHADADEMHVAQAPILSRTPSNLAPYATQGQNAANQSFEVWNSGGGTLSYTVSDDASWLSVSPSSGTSTGERDTITVSYSTSGLSAGTYNATITITASGAGGSPQTVSVTLSVNAPIAITRHRALLVGIDHYAPGYARDLDSCINDATGIRDQVLLGDPQQRWVGANITFLTDSQATKSSIRSALQTMAANATAGDLVVYFHSSHGGKSSGLDTFLCSYDANYTDAELAADLAQFPSTAKVVVIVDACNSGGLFKSTGWPFASRVMEHYRDVKTAQFKAAAMAVPKTIGGNIAFMTAADYDQLSLTGRPYSLYAGFLITGCAQSGVDANGNGEFDFYELHTYAAEQASQQNGNQTAQASNVGLLQALVARAVTANGLAQTITFGTLGSKTFGDAAFTVGATASSSLPVSFSIVSGPATLSGNTVTLTGAGTVVVRATQAGNAIYSAAPNVDRPFTVAKASQTIAFGPLVNKGAGDPPFAVSATASSGLSPSFSIVSGPATISGSMITLTGAAGTVVVRAAQAGNANYNAAANVDQSFSVGKINQTITFGALGNKTAGDAPFTVSATASSGLPVSFTIISGPATISGNTITLTGVGTVVVRASQAGDANYNAASPVDQTFTVGKVNQTITFGALGNKTAGDPPFTVNATASSGLSVSFSIVSGPATLSGNTITLTGVGTVVVRASQAGDVNYNAASNVDQSFTVSGSGSFAVRQLPAGYSPASKFTVTITATPAANVGVYAVEDSPPAGWTVTVGTINNNGSFDAPNGKVKFGPFFDATARTLTYEVTPPANATGIHTFVGTASADGVNSPVGGTSSIDRALRHPADNNPADDRITIGEVTAYGSAWKTGATWPLDPNPIPISYVTRAGALWKGGETYRFDPTVASAPLWWVNTGLAPAALRPLTVGPAAPGEASADLAGGFQRNKDFVVTLRVRPGAGVQVYAVEETVPAGWNVKPGSLDQGGAYDGNSRKVKWGPFFDTVERVFTFVLEPGNNADPVVLAGVASFDGVDVSFTGRRAVPRAAFLPENANAGRNVRTDGFRVVVLGEAGKRYDIEATATPWIANSWTPVATNLDGAALVDFTDTLATSSNRRFYRVIER